MILDGIVCIVVIGSMVQGYRHGLLRTFVRTVGWLAALVLSLFFSPKLKALILDNTDIYAKIYTNIDEKVGTILTPDQIRTDMPTIIQHPFLSFTDSLSNSVAEGLSNFILTILCFLAVTLVVNLVLNLMLSLFSKERNRGITGFADGSAGMLFGFAKGILYVFIFLGFMFPLTSLVGPNLMNSLAESLHNSILSIELYHNNLVLLIVRDLL